MMKSLDIEWVKYSLLIIGSFLGISFTVGVFVRNIERDALQASERIISIEDRLEKVEGAFSEISQRLSRIEGKLDVAIGVRH